MAQLKTLSLFGLANSGGITQDLEVPAGKTVVVQSIDFSGPSFTGIGSKLIADPDGTPMTIAASSGDKFVSIPMGGMPVIGSGTAGVDAKKLRIELKKVGPGAAVELGCVVIYEEL